LGEENAEAPIQGPRGFGRKRESGEEVRKLTFDPKRGAKL